MFVSHSHNLTKLSGVNIHGLELSNGVLKGFKFTQGLDGGVPGCRRVESCQGHCQLHGQGELSSAEDEKLPPGVLQKQELVPVGQGGEGWHVLGPSDIHEKEPGGNL